MIFENINNLPYKIYGNLSLHIILPIILKISNDQIAGILCDYDSIILSYLRGVKLKYKNEAYLLFSDDSFKTRHAFYKLSIEEIYEFYDDMIKKSECDRKDV